jgi:hypothetical protein
MELVESDEESLISLNGDVIEDQEDRELLPLPNGWVEELRNFDIGRLSGFEAKSS